MKTGPRILTLCALLTMATWGQCNPPPNPPSQQLALEESKNKQKRLRKKIAALQKKIQLQMALRDQTSLQLQQTEKRISALDARIRKINAETRQLKQELIKFDKTLEKKRLQAQTIRHKLTMLLRSAYQLGGQQRLKLLLNGQAPQRLNRLLTYSEHLQAARSKQLAQLYAAMEEIRRLTQEIEQKRNRLNQLQTTTDIKKQALKEQSAQRAELLSILNRELADQQKQLHHWREDEQQLENLIKDIQQALQALDLPEQHNFFERRGKLNWPARGRIETRFGTRKVGNLRWDGIMIALSEGTPITAVHAGRVAYADWLRGYGLLLIIDHGHGYMTLYGHLQGAFKETGDWVETGELIGLAGKSGGRNQVSLYFGIRHNGKPLNPVSWVKHNK